MKKVLFLLSMVIFTNLALGKILKRHAKITGNERELQTSLVPAKTQQNRKLGLEDDLQREHEDEQNLSNMKLMMINMKKEGELRTLQSIINEIGDRVEEINDTIRSKTNEFIDKVDSVRRAQSSSRNLLKVTAKTEKGDGR